MLKKESGLSSVNVLPGQIHMARDPIILETILGSCVSVVFWSARVGAGALCHGVLPRHPTKKGGELSPTEGGRYVDYSIRYLARQLDALGAVRREVEVKLFGGADVLPVSSERGGKPSVGALNCLAALEVLAAEGFRVAASDLGGSRGRKIQFHTGTGEVLLQRLKHWSGL
jgi:chemotaxis protein CheD